MTASEIEALGTVVAAVAAAGAVVVARRQLIAQSRSTEGQFLLELDAAFRTHDSTHRKLRPASAGAAPDNEVGAWSGSDARGPANADEWADVEAYMGLFERVNRMIDRGLLDVAFVSDVYGYRVGNIWANPRIRQEKLVKNADYWRNFIDLTAKLEETGLALR